MTCGTQHLTEGLLGLATDDERTRLKETMARSDPAEGISHGLLMPVDRVRSCAAFVQGWVPGHPVRRPEMTTKSGSKQLCRCPPFARFWKHPGSTR